MATGTVKYFSADRGFGFIVCDDGQGEIFVHITNCSEEIDVLAKGQRVRFDERPNRRFPDKTEAFAVALI